MTDEEQFVLDQLAQRETMHRFQLMDADGSPLQPKTSYYVLRGMIEKGLIIGQLEGGHSAHRWYRLA